MKHSKQSGEHCQAYLEHGTVYNPGFNETDACFDSITFEAAGSTNRVPKTEIVMYVWHFEVDFRHEEKTEGADLEVIESSFLLN